MHVLINAISASLGGGLTVLRQLLPALTRVDGGSNRYTVIGRPDARAALDPDHPRIRFAVSGLGARGLATRLIWEQVVLPARAWLGGVDLVFSPSNLAVWGCPLPQILMFQNLAPFDPLVVGQLRDWRRLRLELLRGLSIASARFASRVVFISEAQRRTILPQLGLSGAGCSRIYLGRDPIFSPAAAQLTPALRAKLGLPERYLLCVSQFYHYKNLVELVHGFARARPKLPDDLGLALVGALHERSYVAEVERAIDALGLAGRVRIVGPVPYPELPPLYAGSAAFIFPSTCESFPNILIEGLASGVPVLSSSRCSMPELAGEAALYFDPAAPSEIAEVIVRGCQDADLRSQLSAAGPRRAARYDWERTARELLLEFARALALS